MRALFYFVCALFMLSTSSLAFAQELVLDTVVASIDGKPITLSDISSRMNTTTQVTAQDVASDPRIRYVLDELIAQRLIEAECERRKLRVSDSDIEDYLTRVAERNNMTLDQFSAALSKEGKNLDQFRQQARIEILRARLMNDIMRAVPPATDKEVKEYLDAHPELKKKGTHISLRQILASHGKGGEGAAEKKIYDAQRRVQAGLAFEDVARMLSDAPEASSGGSLGLLLLEELAEPIQAVLQGLQPKTLSPILRSEAGYHLFWIDDRMELTKTSKKKLKEQVGAMLERQKLQQKQAEFFSKEIYERHAVEKKL